MAVVRKTSETRNRNLAKATIRYIMHRRELGERITRPLFSGEEGDSQKLAAYEAIDHAPRGTRFLRVTVSPDPKREDTNRDLNLRELTRSALSALQERFPDQDIQFFASAHEGHTDNRHVNLLVLMPAGRLTKHHWKAMREAATENAQAQRATLNKELGGAADQSSFPFQARMRETRSPGYSRSTGGGVAKQPPLCPLCLGELERRGRFLECETCEISLAKGAGIGLEIRYDDERQKIVEEVGDL
jgi:hypothetical protein